MKIVPVPMPLFVFEFDEEFEDNCEHKIENLKAALKVYIDIDKDDDSDDSDNELETDTFDKYWEIANDESIKEKEKEKDPKKDQDYYDKCQSINIFNDLAKKESSDTWENFFWQLRDVRKLYVPHMVNLHGTLIPAKEFIDERNIKAEALFLVDNEDLECVILPAVQSRI
jgi:hypothetical protein